MQNARDFKALFDQIQYKDNWELYLGWDAGAGGRHWMQIRFMAPCTYTGKIGPQHSRKYFLSPHMTDSEVISTVFKAIQYAEIHECQEQFKYKGHSIFSPHFDIEALVDLCKNGKFDARPVPPEPPEPPEKSETKYNFPYFNQMGGEDD